MNVEVEGNPPPDAAGEARPLYWPLDALWVIFRPVSFYGSQIERLQLKAALMSAAVNVAITVVIGLLGVLWANNFPVWSRMEQISAALVMILAWLGGLAVVIGQGFTYAPAISDTADFTAAVRRACRLACSATAVNPLVTLALVDLMVNWREIHRVGMDVFGSDFLEPLCAGLGLLLITWPYVLLLVGLVLDGRGRQPGLRPCGEKRCDRCGYDLRIIPDEGQCPECGRPVAESFDPMRRALPPAERPAEGRRLVPRLRTYWSALFVPRRFWDETLVRRDSRIARNLFLRTLFRSCAAWTLLFLVCYGAVLRAAGELRKVSHVPALLVATAYVFVGLFVGLLVLSQAKLLVCSAVSRLRGNTLRHDELGRIGYYGLGLPMIVEGLVATCSGLCFLLAVLVTEQFYIVRGSAFWNMAAQALLAAGGLGLAVFAAAAILSALRLIRAMEAARFANF